MNGKKLKLCYDPWIWKNKSTENREQNMKGVVLDLRC